jgi:tetratricopeptide (TPR) repeat protein
VGLLGTKWAKNFYSIWYRFLKPSSITHTFPQQTRILYVPSIGWCVLVAVGAERLYRRHYHHRHRRSTHQPNSASNKNTASVFSVGLILAVVLAAFAAKTVTRNTAWASRPALFRAGLQAARSNAKVFYNYGNYERDMGNAATARLCYKEAIRLWPGYVIAWNNLATVAANETEIEGLLQRALDLDPGHATSLYNLADLYRQRGEYRRAAYYLSHCITYTRCLAGAEVMLADIRRQLTKERNTIVAGGGGTISAMHGGVSSPLRDTNIL